VSTLAIASFQLLTRFYPLSQRLPIRDGDGCCVCTKYPSISVPSVSLQILRQLSYGSQFRTCSIFNALFLLYAIIQIREVRDDLVDTSTGGVSSIPIDVLTAIIPIVISVAEIAYIGLGWKIYHEFGWKVYKFLGADRRIKKMYADYQVYECLVKFDVFFWVGFSVQFIWLVLHDTDWEYYVTCAALPLSIVLLVEGHLAARHENKWMMATFMVGCVGAMIYFIYKVDFSYSSMSYI